MTISLFTRQLTFLSLSLILFSFVFSGLHFPTTTFWLYFLGTLSFVIFSIFIFFYAMTTSKSDYLFSFNNVVIASFLIKLLMAVGFLMAFEKFFQPSGDSHVVHYLVLYIAFTVYEVYFLTKLARDAG